MAGKMRSPNYPALSLAQALQAAEKVWKAEKRTPIDHDTAARALGFKSLSGPARVAIGALRQYGLIQKADKGQIKLSDLAVCGLHSGPDDKQAALRRAATNPSLFKELAVNHSEASDAAIRSYLITKKGFAEDGARKAAKAFHETLKLAKAGDSGYTPGDEQETPENMSGNETGQFIGVDGKAGQKLAVRMFSWPLAKGVTAEVRLTGDEITPSHLEMLRQYLDLAKTALDNEG